MRGGLRGSRAPAMVAGLCGREGGFKVMKTEVAMGPGPTGLTSRCSQLTGEDRQTQDPGTEATGSLRRGSGQSPGGESCSHPSGASWEALWGWGEFGKAEQDGEGQAGQGPG